MVPQVELLFKKNILEKNFFDKGLEQGWPTFFPKPPILFKSSLYPPHDFKIS